MASSNVALCEAPMAPHTMPCLAFNHSRYVMSGIGRELELDGPMWPWAYEAILVNENGNALSTADGMLTSCAL